MRRRDMFVPAENIGADHCGGSGEERSCRSLELSKANRTNKGRRPFDYIPSTVSNRSGRYA
jgi:hypothetical protein